MDLTAGQQKALFAAVVVVLAGLGVFLIAAPHGGGSKKPSAAGTTPAAPPSSASAGSPSATPAPSATGSASVNIYQWLPFSQAQLAQASTLTTAFLTRYDTFTYTESTASYMATLNSLVSTQLAQTLRSGYTTPGVAQTRSKQKQISSGSASIDSIRSFGSSSITFVATANQKLSSTQGTNQNSTQYAVTLTQSGGSWQVFDLELASAGNS